MYWQRASKYHEVSADGYAVAGVAGADGWQFAAWTPDQYPTVHWRNWPPPELSPPGSVYPLGSPVPQRYRLLGFRPTAADARALCEAHASGSLPALPPAVR